jgi:tetratricopeptide (TPR) repeat protein
MSGDHGYRAVLADCERALGRPEVALRLVADALTESPDEEELAELRLVEAGARRDLGEDAAARLVLEAALGGRPTPQSLTEGDEIRLRFAAAYADLLHAQGEEVLAQEWHDAVIALDPDALADSVEFTDLEELADELGETEVDDAADAAELDDAELDDAESLEAAIEAEFDDSRSDEPEVDGAAFPTTGRSFQDEVEAEVAELLGENADGPEDAAPPVGEADSTDR